MEGWCSEMGWDGGGMVWYSRLWRDSEMGGGVDVAGQEFCGGV